MASGLKTCTQGLGTTILIIAACFALAANSQPIKGAYYPAYALDYFPASSINTNLFTHIYYAFLSPNSATFKFDNIDQTQAAQLQSFTSTLHGKNPPVKVLFSIGGGSVPGSLFASMASSPSSRSAFILSSIDTARKFGFDGVDLDWEYPENPTEMTNFGSLVREWRAAIQNEAGATGRQPLLLSAAVYYSPDILLLSATRRSYPRVSVGNSMDWINIMSYDYKGSWDTSVTGAHAALYDPKSNVSTSYGLMAWIRANVPRSKLIMGLPLYGRTWKLRDPNSSGIGAPAVGVGPGADAAMTYAEIVDFNRANNARVVYDPVTVSTYSVAGTSWIGYDDTRSVGAKISYAGPGGLGIGGYFLWQLTGDYQWQLSQTASQQWKSS